MICHRRSLMCGLLLCVPGLPAFAADKNPDDPDWVVKLIDVYPPDFPNPEPNPRDIKMCGYQQLLRGDVMRGRFRNSLLLPGKV